MPNQKSNENLNETELYISDSIKTWILTGFYSREDIHEMINDILEDCANEELMRQIIDIEFEKKIKEEQFWSPITDCDRLDSVFFELDQNGICGCQNAGYEMSDGYSEVAEFIYSTEDKEKYNGYCFYHGQDIERAIKGFGLSLAFGDLKDDVEKTIKVGYLIQSLLEKHNFEVKWNGNPEIRIDIPKIDWKRRYQFNKN